MCSAQAPGGMAAARPEKPPRALSWLCCSQTGPGSRWKCTLGRRSGWGLPEGNSGQAPARGISALGVCRAGGMGIRLIRADGGLTAESRSPSRWTASTEFTEPGGQNPWPGVQVAWPGGNLHVGLARQTPSVYKDLLVHLCSPTLPQFPYLSSSLKGRI